LAEAKLTESDRGERLLQQVDRWRQAQHLHQYLAAMRATIDAMTDPDAARAAEEWFAWAQKYADQLNPLTQRLEMPPPPKATPEALKSFLDGWSPYGPGW